MKKKSPMALNIGTSSILLIFILLSLVTFAILSLSSANADYKLTQALKSRTGAYYIASNSAELQLTEIDEQLTSFLNENDDISEYVKKINEKLCAKGYTYSTISENNTSLDALGTLHWQVEITEQQSLFVEITLLSPHASTSLFNVTQWKVINTNDWEGSANINLYTGE